MQEPKETKETEDMEIEQLTANLAGAAIDADAETSRANNIMPAKPA